MSSRPVSTLIAGLNADVPDTRYEAAKALSEMGHRAAEAVPDLLNLLRDDNGRVRAQAAEAIGRAGAPPEQMFGPDLNPALLVYSEGWGPDGLGAGILYLVEDDSGAYHWSNLAYSHKHFDR